MKIIKRPLTNGQYITEPIEKKSIFIHHTCGLNTEGAWRWWNSTPDRVGTAYIIDRDGIITECFEPENWAFHLGIKGNHFQDKASVGIELVAAGGLYLVENEFVFYPLFPNKTRGTVIPKGDVVVLKDKWRGYQYFHKYTDEQLKALEELLHELANRFKSIPLGGLKDNFYQFNKKVVSDNLGGIWSHTTVREDKSDIYPDSRLIKMISGLNVIKDIPKFKDAQKAAE